MFVPLLALPLYFLPASEECKAAQALPKIEVTVDKQDPNFTNNDSISDLGRKAPNAYHPAGTEGPAWHTSGLTQSNVKFEPTVQDHSLTASDNSISCVFIDSITVKIILAPTVWVANEFPAGSCMYYAVRDHEMKHVNADRIVTDRHVGKIKDALVILASHKDFFGPAKPDIVKAEVEQFSAELTNLMNREINDFYSDELKSQRAIDTLQEYQRVSHLCPSQNK